MCPRRRCSTAGADAVPKTHSTAIGVARAAVVVSASPTRSASSRPRSSRRVLAHSTRFPVRPSRSNRSQTSVAIFASSSAPATGSSSSSSPRSMTCRMYRSSTSWAIWPRLARVDLGPPLGRVDHLASELVPEEVTERTDRELLESGWRKDVADEAVAATRSSPVRPENRPNERAPAGGDDPAASQEVRRRLDKERRGIAAPGATGRASVAPTSSLSPIAGIRPPATDSEAPDRARDAPDRDVPSRRNGNESGPDRPGRRGPGGPAPSLPAPATGDEKPAAIAFDRPSGCRVVESDLLALLGGQDRTGARRGGATRPRRTRARPRGRVRRPPRMSSGPTMIPDDSRPSAAPPVERARRVPWRSGQDQGGVDSVEHLELTEQVGDDRFESSSGSSPDGRPSATPR